MSAYSSTYRMPLLQSGGLGSFCFRLYVCVATCFALSRLLQTRSLRVALLLVFSVLFRSLYLVLSLGAAYWAGYLISMLFIGGILVVLVFLTRLSGGPTPQSPRFVTRFFCFLISSSFSFFLGRANLLDFSDSLFFISVPAFWGFGLLGGLSCLLYLAFLALLAPGRGPLRKLFRC